MKLSLLAILSLVYIHTESAKIRTNGYKEEVINLPECEAVFLQVGCGINSTWINYNLESNNGIHLEVKDYRLYCPGLRPLITMFVITREYMAYTGKMDKLNPPVGDLRNWNLTVSSSDFVWWDVESLANISIGCSVAEVTETDLPVTVAEGTEVGKVSWQSDWRSITVSGLVCVLGIISLMLVFYIFRMKTKRNEGSKTSDEETHANVHQDAQAVDMRDMAPIAMRDIGNRMSTEHEYEEIDAGLAMAAPRMPEERTYQEAQDVFQVAIASGATSRMSEEPIYEN